MNPSRTELRNHRPAGKLWLRALLIMAALCFSVPAQAHVKWFVDYDVAKPPLPIDQVLNSTFLYLFLSSVLAVYLFFLTDRFVYKKGYLVKLDQRMRMFDDLSSKIIRACTCLFFICLWLWDLKVGSSFYITPELKTPHAYVTWLHLIMALCALSRHTTPLTGLGIFVLYGAAVRDYGTYHMLDYLIFLGIGYFLVVADIKRGQWLKSGFIVLFASTGLTLGWAAIEKFCYPQWTYPMLEQNPDMLMGLTPYLFMLCSGFAEFFLAFVLLGAVSMFGRFVALGLQSVFVLSIFKFGVVDAIGHLMIIAILFVLLIRGPTDARNMLVLRDKAVWTEAYFMTGLYVLAFVLIFIFYYGFHHLRYGV